MLPHPQLCGGLAFFVLLFYLFFTLCGDLIFAVLLAFAFFDALLFICEPLLLLWLAELPYPHLVFFFFAVVVCFIFDLKGIIYAIVVHFLVHFVVFVFGPLLLLWLAGLSHPHLFFLVPPHYCLEFLHKLYTLALFKLPDCYSQNVPVEYHDRDDATQALCKRWVTQWSTISCAAFLLLLSIAYRCQVSYDLQPPVILFPSAVCSLFAAIYAVTLALTFGNLEINIECFEWIQDIPRPPENRFWNPWIMVSLPVVCFLWGLACFILSFMWPAGETSEKQYYYPHITATCIIVLGFNYLRLMMRDVPKAHPHEAASDPVGRVKQFIIGGICYILDIRGGIGGAGGAGNQVGGTGGRGEGPTLHFSP